MNSKSLIYAEHASKAFNDFLDKVVRRITLDVIDACGDNLIALILGGGYGRGEGGVCTAGNEELPYNDLDFSLVVKSKKAVPHEKLKEISHKHEKIIGIDVDFSRPLTIKNIKDWPHWLMWYDLYFGHIILYGPDNLLIEYAPDYIKNSLLPVEAVKLLLNRGAGLLRAMIVSRGIGEAPDSDFVRRNYYKCLLAAGDSLLILHKRYTTRYSGRDVLLAGLNISGAEIPLHEIKTYYNDALSFKFRPDSISEKTIGLTDLEEIARLWGAVLLYVENCRFNRQWQSIDDYIKWKKVREKEQNTIFKLHRNFIQNARFGTLSLRYRRELLYRSLPVLLGITEIKPRNWEQDSERFLKTWFKFN